MQVVEQLKAMSDDRFLSIYEALANQGFGPLDGEVAKALKFRPQSIRKLPMAQRARRARTILQHQSNAELTYELFGTYLMRHRKELITSFLDATGVAHDDGMLAGDMRDNPPDAKKLAEAVEELDAKFPAEDVTLYLGMCAEHWPSVTEIQSIWRTRFEGD